jgi:primosomal protein N' (replication factor Y)
LAVALRRRFGSRLLGPIAPAVDRIRGEYLMQLLLKVESSASRLRANELVKEEVDKLLTNKEFKQVTVAINVDPQ